MKYHTLFVMFEKRQNFKLSSAANLGLTIFRTLRGIFLAPFCNHRSSGFFVAQYYATTFEVLDDIYVIPCSPKRVRAPSP